MPHVLTITKQIQAIIAPRDDNNAMTSAVQFIIATISLNNSIKNYKPDVDEI